MDDDVLVDKTDELSEALEAFQIASGDSSARSTAVHPDNGADLVRAHYARRRSSFDERRIPPTLLEGETADEVGVIRDQSPVFPASGRRSRSDAVQRPSRELLRRVSSDTAYSLDFDSDPETFYPSRAPSIASRRTSLGGIHLRDHSSNEINTFASQVQIPAFHTVGSTFGGFVAYECRILTREGTTMTKMKRYSAFCQLRDQLIRAYPQLTNALDSLPSKSLAKFRVTFLEKRRKRLAFWLSTVLLHPVLGASEQAKIWILD